MGRSRFRLWGYISLFYLLVPGVFGTTIVKPCDYFQKRIVTWSEAALLFHHLVIPSLTLILQNAVYIICVVYSLETVIPIDFGFQAAAQISGELEHCRVQELLRF